MKRWLEIAVLAFYACLIVMIYISATLGVAHLMLFINNLFE